MVFSHDRGSYWNCGNNFYEDFEEEDSMEKFWFMLFALISIVILPLVWIGGLLLKVSRAVNSDRIALIKNSSETIQG